MTPAPSPVVVTEPPRVKHTAHAFEVRPVAGPKGFRWFVQALVYPMAKSGSPGDPPIFFGPPKRHNIAGPFKSKALAQAAIHPVSTP